MNKFLEKYKEERESGSNEYEALGVSATHIAVNGTWEDLQTVYDFHHEDYMQATEKELELARKRRLTSYERDMKLVGHKESDFE